MLNLVRLRGLRSLSLTALCFLERLSYGGATMTELANRAQVSVSAVAPQLAALYRMGLVERVSGSTDLREKVWRITDRGLEAFTNHGSKKDCNKEGAAQSSSGATETEEDSGSKTS